MERTEDYGLQRYEVWELIGMYLQRAKTVPVVTDHGQGRIAAMELKNRLTGVRNELEKIGGLRYFVGLSNACEMRVQMPNIGEMVLPGRAIIDMSSGKMVGAVPRTSWDELAGILRRVGQFGENTTLSLTDLAAGMRSVIVVRVEKGLEKAKMVVGKAIVKDPQALSHVTVENLMVGRPKVGVSREKDVLSLTLDAGVLVGGASAWGGGRFKRAGESWTFPSRYGAETMQVGLNFSEKLFNPLDYSDVVALVSEVAEAWRSMR